MRVAVSMIQSVVARVGYTAVHSPINLLIFSYSHCRPDASHDPVLDLVPDAAAWHAYVEHGLVAVAGSEQVAQIQHHVAVAPVVAAVRMIVVEIGRASCRDRMEFL